MLQCEILITGNQTTSQGVKSRVTTQKVQAKERITTVWRMVNKVQSKETYSFSWLFKLIILMATDSNLSNSKTLEFHFNWQQNFGF